MHPPHAPNPTLLCQVTINNRKSTSIILIFYYTCSSHELTILCTKVIEFSHHDFWCIKVCFWIMIKEHFAPKSHHTICWMQLVKKCFIQRPFVSKSWINLLTTGNAKKCFCKVCNWIYVSLFTKPSEYWFYFMR